MITTNTTWFITERYENGSDVYYACEDAEQKLHLVLHEDALKRLRLDGCHLITAAYRRKSGVSSTIRDSSGRLTNGAEVVVNLTTTPDGDENNNLKNLPSFDPGPDVTTANILTHLILDRGFKKFVDLVNK